MNSFNRPSAGLMGNVFRTAHLGEAPHPYGFAAEDWSTFWEDMEVVHKIGGTYESTAGGISGSWFKAYIVKIVASLSGDPFISFREGTAAFLRLHPSLLEPGRFRSFLMLTDDFFYRGYVQADAAMFVIRDSLRAAVEQLDPSLAPLIDLVRGPRSETLPYCPDRPVLEVLADPDVHLADKLTNIIDGLWSKNCLTALFPPDNGRQYTAEAARKFHAAVCEAIPDRNVRLEAFRRLFQGTTGSVRWLLRYWMEMEKG